MAVWIFPLHSFGTFVFWSVCFWWSIACSSPSFVLLMAIFIFLEILNDSSKRLSLSHAQLFATPWTAAHQAPPSMSFPRQEYWSGFLFPSPGDLPDPVIKPGFLPCTTGRFFTDRATREAQVITCLNANLLMLLIPWFLCSKFLFQLSFIYILIKYIFPLLNIGFYLQHPFSFLL